MRLPFFDSKQKPWVGILGILSFMIFYMIPNHFPLFTPHEIYLFNFEKEIPFMDWTIWFYISDYLYIATVFTLLSNKDNMNKIFYSQIGMLIFAMIIFFILPVTYPRPEVEYTGISGWMVGLVHSADTPGNSCPSIHVGMTFLAGFGFIKEQKGLFSLFMFWALLISISTLTLKQHYLFDVIAGFIMAILFYFLAQKFIKKAK
jgi:membrane-associated phospholipid phosphatase